MSHPPVNRLLGTDQRLTIQLAQERLVMAAARRTRPRGRLLSITEQLARAPSPFALEMILRDADRFYQADAKTRDRWARTAYARDCELRGVLP